MAKRLWALGRTGARPRLAPVALVLGALGLEALGLGALELGAAPAAAETGTGLFLGLRAIGSAAEVDQADGSGFGGPALVENDDDEVAGVALVAGYVFKELPLRAELELGHRFRFDLDVRDMAPGATADYELNIATTSALASVILEWRNDTDFTPFLGGTLGWARNWADTKRVVLATQVSAETDSHSDNLAWGATAGLDWDLAEAWVAQIAYRYINLGEVETGTLAGTRVSAEDYVSHDVLLTVGYRF